MEEIAWAAIGLLAVSVFGSFGLYLGLGSRVEGLSNRMEAGFAQVDARFARIETEMDSRFAQVDARFDRLEAKFDGVIARMDSRIDSLSDSLSRHIEGHAG